MKTCLGSLLLLLTIAALVFTVVYHTSVNSELRFEPRDANAEYINTRRSYRPQVQAKKTAPTDSAGEKTAGIQDDDTAEEVEP